MMQRNIGMKWNNLGLFTDLANRIAEQISLKVPRNKFKNNKVTMLRL